jgi:hypothetical protein
MQAQPTTFASIATSQFTGLNTRVPRFLKTANFIGKFALGVGLALSLSTQAQTRFPRPLPTFIPEPGNVLKVPEFGFFTVVPGKIPSSFAISPSGAATYSIPIQVPPGIGGLEPKISLEYNSQASNGVAGVGWNIGGLSAITRCPQTPSQDPVSLQGSVKYDWNDRYCLDGQRLVLVDNNGNGVTYASQLGTHFRTEIDNFSRIWPIELAGAGHARFEVKTKSGLTMQYGETIDSRIEAMAGRAEVAVWALNKITDLAGNTMTISYFKDPTYRWFYPASIKYAGHELYFHWEPLHLTGEPVIRQYHAGALSEKAYILKELRVFTGSLGQTKTYKMAYSSSPISSKTRLTNVAECVGTECKQPLNINYPSEGFTNFDPMPATPNNGYPVGANGYRYLQGDFNGDGKQDLLHLISDAEARVWLSDGNGKFDIRPSYRPPGNYAISSNQYNFQVGDFNGDGKTDVVHFVNNDYLDVWLSNGDGTFTTMAPFPKTPGYVMSSNNYKFLTGDFNGDGLTDLVHLVTNSSGSYVRVWISKGNGEFVQHGAYKPGDGYDVSSNSHNYQTGDFDGDGKTDLIHFYDNNRAFVWFSNGDGTFRLPVAFPNTTYAVGANGYKYITGDFNGDGKTDLFHIVDNSYGNTWLSKGDGSFDIRGGVTPWLGYALAGADAMRPYNYKSGDFNGDGKDDLIHFVNNDYVHVWLSKGDGGFVPQTGFPNNGYGVGMNNYNYVVGDFNGDGRSDMVHFVANTHVHVWHAKGSPSDMASSFNDGGDVTNVYYEGLAHPESTRETPSNFAYEKFTDAVYPTKDIQNSLKVVSRVEKDNGAGGKNWYSYKYSGLKLQQGNGRGFLGFKYMTTDDSTNKTISFTEFYQGFPYSGIPYRTVIYQNLAAPQPYLDNTLKRVTNTVACRQPPLGGDCQTGVGQRYFPYISQSVEERWDASKNRARGEQLPTITTFTDYGVNTGDALFWGNPTEIRVSSTDGSVKTTRNQYRPADAANGNWVLGRLIKSSVTSSVPKADTGVGQIAGGVAPNYTPPPPPAPPTPAQLQAAKAVLPGILSLLLGD